MRDCLLLAWANRPIVPKRIDEKLLVACFGEYIGYESNLIDCTGN